VGKCETPDVAGVFPAAYKISKIFSLAYHIFGD